MADSTSTPYGLYGSLSTAVLHDGKVKLRVENGVIQYRYEDDNDWRDLVDLYEYQQNDYEDLDNKPQINGVQLVGDKSFQELGDEPLTNSELKSIIDAQFDAIFGGL